MTDLMLPPQALIDRLLNSALSEDLAEAGDITSATTILQGTTVSGSIIAREDGAVAGLQMGLRTFELLDPSVRAEPLVADGDRVGAGTVLASVTGDAHTILAGERVCLNLLGHLSGIATVTAHVVALVAHTRAKIIDTRKTTPGLRVLEKYAVRAGGGSNHRFGLYDAVLIKDNHLDAAGGVAQAVKSARTAVGHTVKVQVEVEDLAQLHEAITAGADAVLLDNMSPERLRAAVAAAAGRCVLEASGGITPDNVVAVAESGVDLISLGWITHSAPRWDVALDLDSP